MGARPSRPTEEQRAELEALKEETTKRAGAAIAQSDVLLFMTGAGWSADSGLAVYADVANIAAYHERGLTYHDICNPAWLEEDPELFYGFWGKCFNDYRDVTPHEGYRIIARWRDRLFRYTHTSALLQQATGAPGAFFCFTSNVDAHSLHHFSPREVRECHGNSETWQCAHRHCPGLGDAASSDPFDPVGGATVDGAMVVDSSPATADATAAAEAPAAGFVRSHGGGGGEFAEGARAHATPPERWAAPAEFRFGVHPETVLAALGPPGQCARLGSVAAADEPPDEPAPRAEQRAPSLAAPQHSHVDAFASNWPRCVGCGGKARPSILMFGDSQWHDDHDQSDRWESWRVAVEKLARARGGKFRLTIVEAGAGGNVTTVRNLSEDILASVRDNGGVASLVRINPELPLADQPTNQRHTFSLLSTGLEAIRAIDAAMSLHRDPHALDAPSTWPPHLLSLENANLERDDPVDSDESDLFAKVRALRSSLNNPMQDIFDRMRADASDAREACHGERVGQPDVHDAVAL